MAAVITNALKYDALALAIASGDTIKIAFFSDAKDATYLAYATTNEVTQAGASPALNAGGYTLSGRTLSADGSATASLYWSDPAAITPNATLTFRSLVIYNATRSNRTIWANDYGSTQTWNAGTAYTIDLPNVAPGQISLA